MKEFNLTYFVLFITFNSCSTGQAVSKAVSTSWLILKNREVFEMNFRFFIVKSQRHYLRIISYLLNQLLKKNSKFKRYRNKISNFKKSAET